MKALVLAFAFTVIAGAQASAEECRRVTQPTVLAVFAHGGVWTRTASLGATFRTRNCDIRMNGRLFCEVHPYREPPVYLQHTDHRGREYTVRWTKDCR